MPVESLMRVVSGASEEPQAMCPYCVAGDYVIVRNCEGGRAVLPFVLGEALDIDDEECLAQWYFPGKSREANMKVGRKKQVLDIFSSWSPADTIPVEELVPLPPSIVKADKILLWGFDLENDSQIPFKVLDRILTEHHIDITGLLMSSTNRGNLYRAHRLMQWLEKTSVLWRLFNCWLCGMMWNLSCDGVASI